MLAPPNWMRCKIGGDVPADQARTAAQPYQERASSSSRGLAIHSTRRTSNKVNRSRSRGAGADSSAEVLPSSRRPSPNTVHLINYRVPCEKRTSGASTTWKKPTSLRSEADSTRASNCAGSLPSGFFDPGATAEGLTTADGSVDCSGQGSTGAFALRSPHPSNIGPDQRGRTPGP